MLKMFISLCFLSSMAWAGGKAFHDISLADALKRAGTENKYVFVDFYTTWCGPCKLMDRTTFKDSKVVAWLEQHTIPLAIDAEAQVEIAKRYTITTYPSLVFIKADGSIAYKAIGYHDANRFLEAGARVLSGYQPDKQAREALAANPDDAGLKFALAKSLIEVGKNDEAFALCQQILPDVQAGRDSGVDHFSYYYMLVQQGGQVGRDLVKKEYERTYAMLTAGEITATAVADYAVLAGVSRGKSPLELFDGLKSAGIAAEKLALFKNVLFRPMLSAGRYADIDALEPIETRVAAMDEMLAKIKDHARADQMVGPMMSEKTRMYQVLRGMNQDERADRLAGAILGQSQTAEVYNGLAWADYEAKRMDQRTLEWAKRANDLSGGTHTDILDTYARVLAGLGDVDKAVEVLKAALAVVPEGEGREVLQTCLSDITKS